MQEKHAESHLIWETFCFTIMHGDELISVTRIKGAPIIEAYPGTFCNPKVVTSSPMSKCLSAVKNLLSCSRQAFHYVCLL